MKIIDKNHGLVDFIDIQPGECGTNGSVVFLKLSEAAYHDWDKACEYGCNAVDLNDGELLRFEPQELVYALEGKCAFSFSLTEPIE